MKFGERAHSRVKGGGACLSTQHLGSTEARRSGFPRLSSDREFEASLGHTRALAASVSLPLSLGAPSFLEVCSTSLGI